ncbi:MAG: polysaccharide deacetylase family protein [Actinobacteria bacterium]|nr:polysaccharide deacetylase family protein [Actinomycetota bacterium]
MSRKIRLLIIFTVILCLSFTFIPNNIYAATKTQATDFVTRFYTHILERNPDAAGLDSHVKQILKKQITGAQLAYNFVFSAEFSAKNKSNEDYLKILFRACFNREADSASYGNWLNLLNKGYSRQYVLAGFVNADEFKNLCGSYGVKAGSLDGGSIPQITATQIPIIELHGIENSPMGRYEISAGAFDYMCGTLKNMGYETITLIDLYNHFAKGTKLPAKPVIITADDGYQSMYTTAFPILKKYKYKMTVFLITSFIGDNEKTRRLNDFDSGMENIPQRAMLTWPEIGQMSKYGLEFQSHSWGHTIMSNIPIDRAKFELIQSKHDIELHTGKPVIFIAWPHGASSDEVISLLPQVGYVGALNASGGVQSLTSIDLTRLNRVEIVSGIPPQAYAEVLNLH